jgi:hypothetical protein
MSVAADKPQAFIHDTSIELHILSNYISTLKFFADFLYFFVILLDYVHPKLTSLSRRPDIVDREAQCIKEPFGEILEFLFLWKMQKGDLEAAPAVARDGFVYRLDHARKRQLMDVVFECDNRLNSHQKNEALVACIHFARYQLASALISLPNLGATTRQDFISSYCSSTGLDECRNTGRCQVKQYMLVYCPSCLANRVSMPPIYSTT